MTTIHFASDTLIVSGLAILVFFFTLGLFIGDKLGYQRRMRLERHIRDSYKWIACSPKKR